MDFEEKQLILPWIILPPDQGESSLSLLVSSPDGTLMEFEITPSAAQKIGPILASAGLWKEFFTSLLASIYKTDENNQNGEDQ